MWKDTAWKQFNQDANILPKPIESYPGIMLGATDIQTQRMPRPQDHKPYPLDQHIGHVPKLVRLYVQDSVASLRLTTPRASKDDEVECQ